MIGEFINTGINLSYIVLGALVLVLSWIIWITRDKNK